MNFCEDLLRKVNQDPRYLSRVIFSDESHFTQEGIFNSHNHHYWSDENPQLIRQRSFQTRWKRNVWAGIMGSQILGPIYLLDNINGANYLEFLQNTMPEFLDEIPLIERNNIIFQQDGARPYNARVVTNYLDQMFPERWMGRYDPIRWPARSPDLNPLDFFLWGYCKEIVYKKLPENIDDLDVKLHEAIWTIDENMLENVQISMLRRLRACVEMDGGDKIIFR